MIIIPLDYFTSPWMGHKSKRYVNVNMTIYFPQHFVYLHNTLSGVNDIKKYARFYILNGGWIIKATDLLKDTQ